MNKEIFSRYGSIIAMVLVLAVMITFAAPFGNAIASGVNNFVNGFGSAMNGNAGGGGSGSSGIKLDAPTNLTLTNDQLSFDLVPNANQYILYVNDEVSATYATSPIDVSTYIETYGTPITFKLVASDSTGAYSNSAATEYIAAGDGKMILKAGTYRFNDDIYIGYESIDGTYDLNFTSYNDVGVTTSYDGIYGDAVVLEFHSPNGTDNWLQVWADTVGWLDDNFRVIIISDDQTVADTFGTWFISNTNYNEVNSIVIEEMTIVDGKYVFDKAQFAGGNSFEYTGFTFTSNSQTFHGIKLEPYNEGASVYWLYYINENGTYTQVAFQDGNWNTNWDYGDGYKTIEFDDETQVPAELKQWLNESASYYNVVLDGEWVFEEIPTKFPENSYVEIPVNATLKSDPSKIITTITITSNIMQEGTTDVNTRSIVFYDADRNAVLEYNDGYVYAPDYDLDLSFDKEWSAAGEENRAIIFEEQLTSEEHFMMIAYNADRVEADNAENVLGLRRFKETVDVSNFTGETVFYLAFTSNNTDYIAMGFEEVLVYMNETSNNIVGTVNDGTITFGSEEYRTINITSETITVAGQTVSLSDEGKAWLLANTEPVEDTSGEAETYTIEAGTYRFNDVLNGLDTFTYVEGEGVYSYDVYLNFINDGNPYTDSEYDFIDIITDEAKSNYGVQYGRLLEGDEKSYLPVYTQSGGWSNAEYQPLTLPNDVEVDNTFGSWFAANTKRVIEVDELPTEDIDTSVLYSVEDVLYKYENDTWFTYVDGAWTEYVAEDESIVGTWVFNDFCTTDITGKFYIDFSCVTSDGETDCSSVYFRVTGTGAHNISVSPGSYSIYDSKTGWFYAGSNVWKITGGTDITNETFITWLKANAAKYKTVDKYYQYVDGAWIEQQP